MTAISHPSTHPCIDLSLHVYIHTQRYATRTGVSAAVSGIYIYVQGQYTCYDPTESFSDAPGPIHDDDVRAPVLSL